jgi:predicted HTH domain antitoxin
MSAADLAAISADDPQMGWDRVIAAYLDGHISLGRAAGLLKQSRFELQARFNRLGLPLRLGTPTVAEGEAEYAALMDDN